MESIAFDANRSTRTATCARHFVSSPKENPASRAGSRNVVAPVLVCRSGFIREQAFDGAVQAIA